jgi:hypothetical protein
LLTVGLAVSLGICVAVVLRAVFRPLRIVALGLTLACRLVLVFLTLLLRAILAGVTLLLTGVLRMARIFLVGLALLTRRLALAPVARIFGVAPLLRARFFALRSIGLAAARRGAFGPAALARF